MAAASGDAIDKIQKIRKSVPLQIYKSYSKADKYKKSVFVCIVAMTVRVQGNIDFVLLDSCLSGLLVLFKPAS